MIQNGDETHTYKLTNVYYTPGIAEPLISIGRLWKKGLVFTNNEDGHGTLIDKESGKIMMRIKEIDQLYPVRTWKPSKSANSAKRKDVAKVHIDPRTIDPGHVHANCWGPTKPAAKGGYDSFVLLTEIATHFRHTVLMKGKKLAFDHYKGFEAWLENQHNVKVKKFHSDRGGEFELERAWMTAFAIPSGRSLRDIKQNRAARASFERRTCWPHLGAIDAAHLPTIAPSASEAEVNHDGWIKINHRLCSPEPYTLSAQS